MDPTFQLVSDSFLILHDFFLIFLNINFTLVFSSCKCVRLHVMTKYKILGFFLKQFIFFRIRIPDSARRFGSDLFRIHIRIPNLYPDPDPQHCFQHSSSVSKSFHCKMMMV